MYRFPGKSNLILKETFQFGNKFNLFQPHTCINLILGRMELHNITFTQFVLILSKRPLNYSNVALHTVCLRLFTTIIGIILPLIFHLYDWSKWLRVNLKPWNVKLLFCIFLDKKQQYVLILLDLPDINYCFWKFTRHITYWMNINVEHPHYNTCITWR